MANQPNPNYPATSPYPYVDANGTPTNDPGFALTNPNPARQPVSAPPTQTQTPATTAYPPSIDANAGATATATSTAPTTTPPATTAPATTGADTPSLHIDPVTGI